MTMLLNDVHSRLNPTEVTDLHCPRDLTELQDCVHSARARGLQISVSGGRHAMGGQQFATGALHIDMSALNRVLASDSQRGLLQIEAGADWPAIIAASHAMAPAADGQAWGIRQKQTGVDTVSLGGSISANAHGRGLLMQPLAEDIEELQLVDANGELLHCSRQVNAELFSLVIGGYGLFGLIYCATLRLAPRVRVRRLVDVIDLDDAVNAVFRRAAQGCLFGDFQFVIDPDDDSFLRRGVMACYKPSEPDEDDESPTADLDPASWLKLLQLAHDDKARAFRLYSQHYLSTDGNHYWSDTHQLSTYLPGYAEFLESVRSEAEAGAGEKESLLIGEHYVPHPQLLDFMAAARDILRASGSEVIYGTIRSIRRDETSFLPWAKADFVCIVLNLRTLHGPAGIERSRQSFRGLIDAAISRGGSFFLTYHRFATAAQVLGAYPEFREFLQHKLHYDPDQLFSSDWYRHYSALLT